MSHSIRHAITAIYSFVAGDAIILFAVVAAFILGEVLVHEFNAANILVALVFLGIIAAGLVATLGRELAGRKHL